MNPENVDRLGRADGLTGEVEGGVPGDIQALRWLSKVRKSCREGVKGKKAADHRPWGMGTTYRRFPSISPGPAPLPQGEGAEECRVGKYSKQR